MSKGDVWLKEFMRKLQLRLGLKTQEELADRLEMPIGTFKMRLQKPGTFRVRDLRNIETVANSVDMSLKEVGVPFL